MPEDGQIPVESTGTAEPASVAEASVAIPSDSGQPQTVEGRHAGFLAAVEGKEPKAEAPKVDTPPEPEKKEPEAKALPEAPEPEEDEDESEVDLLPDEEIDKHKTAPKTLRNYAKSVTKKFGPYVEAVNELGGIEAVKRLDRIQTLVMSAPDRPDHPDVVAYEEDLRKTNPQFMSMLQTRTFFGALDESPELLDSVIKTPPSRDAQGRPTGGLGPNWNVEKLLQLTQLVDDGEIDVDAILEGAKERLSPEERTRKEADEVAAKAKDEATATRIAELEKGNAERAEEAKKVAVQADVESLTKTFADARDPVLRQFKLLPVDGEPDEIKADKEYIVKKIITLTSMELGQSPLMETINRKIASQQKGDDYNWAVIKAADAYKSKFREVAMREAKYFSAYLKNYNQPAAANTKERRPEPLVDGSQASPRTPTPTDQAQVRMTKEERDAGFLARVEGKTGT